MHTEHNTNTERYNDDGDNNYNNNNNPNNIYNLAWSRPGNKQGQ